MNYFTSDTHYGHQNIIAYCNRPFRTVEGMDFALIERWNNVVRPEDTVYHIGDFMMGRGVVERLPQVRAKLNGRIVVVLGNHDKSPAVFKAAGFDETHTSLELQTEHGLLLLTHIPVLPENHPRYKHILCGHVHGEWKYQGKFINVGVDQWDYRPVTLEQLLEGVE